MKVLTVDDNPMTGILLSGTLKDLGHDAIVANDAAEALELFDRKRPHVCILDWMMPDRDGLELACAMRRRDHGPSVYIIMLSGKQDLESVAFAYQLGVDEFIAKPVAPGELKARLQMAARVITLQEQCRGKCQEVAALTAELARLKAA